MPEVTGNKAFHPVTHRAGRAGCVYWFISPKAGKDHLERLGPGMQTESGGDEGKNEIPKTLAMWKKHRVRDKTN